MLRLSSIRREFIAKLQIHSIEAVLLIEFAIAEPKSKVQLLPDLTFFQEFQGLIRCLVRYSPHMCVIKLVEKNYESPKHCTR